MDNTTTIENIGGEEKEILHDLASEEEKNFANKISGESFECIKDDGSEINWQPHSASQFIDWDQLENLIAKDISTAAEESPGDEQEEEITNEIFVSADEFDWLDFTADKIFPEHIQTQANLVVHSPAIEEDNIFSGSLSSEATFQVLDTIVENKVFRVIATNNFTEGNSSETPIISDHDAVAATSSQILRETDEATTPVSKEGLAANQTDLADLEIDHNKEEITKESPGETIHTDLAKFVRALDLQETKTTKACSSNRVAMVTIKNARDVYDLQCHICKESFKNPKVLPCLHSFCHACLDDTINEDERSFHCPVCDLVIPIPTKAAEAFPINSFANNMLNILAVEDPTNCTNCEDRALASSRCLDCVENLCENCVTAHERIRQTKKHKIVTFEELQNNTVDDSIRCPSFCKIHDREILKYFCECCDSAICRDCAIFEHREHNYLDLKEAVKSHGYQLNQLLGNTKEKMPVLKNALENILTVGDDLKERKCQVEEFINQEVNQHIQRLEEKKKILLLHLQQMTDVKYNVLLEQYRRLEFDLRNIESSCEFVDSILKYGNEAEFMDVKYFMLSRLHKLNEHKAQLVPEENDVMKFDANDENLITSTNEFGILTTSEAFAPFCVAWEENNTLSKIGYPSSFDVIVKDRFGVRLTKGNDDVRAILTDADNDTVPVEVYDNQNGSYTIKFKVKCHTDHQLSVYLRDRLILDSPFTILVSTGIDLQKIGPLLTRFGSCGVGANTKLNESYEPWGVCCDKEDNIVVTDHNNHKIQIFDTNGKLIHHFGSRGKNDGEVWYPTGVAVDHSNNIFVADHGNHRIQVFTPEGKFIRKIGSRGNMDGLFKGPCGIAIDLKNRLIVSDRDNHRVQVLTNGGKFLFNIGAYGSLEGKFDSPRHVTVTNDNHILVSDSNNGRVQRFDGNGAYLGMLGKKGSDDGQFQCPSGICTDTEDNLVVADFKNLDLQIFDKKGVFMKKIGDDVTNRSNGIGLFNKPTALCITKSGNIFVADRGSHKISLF